MTEDDGGGEERMSDWVWGLKNHGKSKENLSDDIVRWKTHIDYLKAIHQRR